MEKFEEFEEEEEEPAYEEELEIVREDDGEGYSADDFGMDSDD